MIILTIIILFLGMFALYNTSQKASLGTSGFEKWLQNKPRISKAMGAGSIITSFFLLTNALGFGAGIFYTLVALMAILSLLILLVPLAKVLRGN